MCECVLEAEFVEAALVEDGLSVRLRRTLLNLHLWKMGECVLEADFVEATLEGVYVWGGLCLSFIG